jgi:hypothetical protein
MYRISPKPGLRQKLTGVKKRIVKKLKTKVTEEEKIALVAKLELLKEIKKYID